MSRLVGRVIRSQCVVAEEWMSATYWRDVIGATLCEKGNCDGSVVIEVVVWQKTCLGRQHWGPVGISSVTVHRMQLFKA